MGEMGIVSTSSGGLGAKNNETIGMIVCYSPKMITTSGIWVGSMPWDYSLPVFLLQITLIIITTRFLVFILKPLRQPKVISEILGGVLLGPSVMGRIPKFADIVFPLRSVLILETMANIGLLYFLFLVGIEMDLYVIKRIGKKALTIAIIGMIPPFLIGISLSFFLQTSEDVGPGTFLLFLGVTLSVTAFPVLARILAELKLLNTELGKLALSAAIINDLCAWILISLAVSLAKTGATRFASLLVVVSAVVFVMCCIFVIRPAIAWIIRRTPESSNYNEFYICLIVSGVMICGLITDTLGTHPIFGAFVFGLVIPNGPLGATIIDKLQDFVSVFLLPLFFAISGLRTNIWAIHGSSTLGLLILAIFLSCTGKAVATIIVSVVNHMPMQESVALGLLMNTKGPIEIIILSAGRDQKVLDDQSFAILVIVAVIMTSIITPVITAIYKPARPFIPYKRRTVQWPKRDAELRILACVHTPRNVPTIINLIDASHPTKKSPICVFALHLVELTGRSSAMLIVHNSHKSGGHPALNRTQAQSDHIISAFENYEQHSGGVSVQPLTAISRYSTMHEDICNLAEDKRASLILLPFHKQQTLDGSMEATNPAFRGINQNVLATAPCSVGILVDRGLDGSTRVAATETTHHVAVLFFGGPDDREALAYGWRMAEHPGVCLTVLRFLPGEDAADPVVEPSSDTRDLRILTVITDNEREKKLDDEYINEFRIKNTNDESISYSEKIVNNGEETAAVVRSLDNTHDLYIVGRGQGMISPLTAGLTDWSECPELGAIGDLLASDMSETKSVLVVQQYVGGGEEDNEMETQSSPIRQAHCNINSTNRWPSRGPGTVQLQVMNMQRGMGAGYFG
ncbi:PREDICTED: cation/H(+) antiporter 15-like [Nelumbo nucifera]|nr:PREDICTED: cation/H(+) antiporter 15-like [Nelumbo nucifera]